MIIMKIVLLNTKLDTSRYSYPYDLVKLRSLLWKPFYFAAEFLLDSLTEFQEDYRDVSTVIRFKNYLNYFVSPFSSLSTFF